MRFFSLAKFYLGFLETFVSFRFEFKLSGFATKIFLQNPFFGQFFGAPQTDHVVENFVKFHFYPISGSVKMH
jgi:hypothetical protein